jgi:hypothetical protein
MPSNTISDTLKAFPAIDTAIFVSATEALNKAVEINLPDISWIVQKQLDALKQATEIKLPDIGALVQTQNEALRQIAELPLSRFFDDYAEQYTKILPKISDLLTGWSKIIPAQLAGSTYQIDQHMSEIKSALVDSGWIVSPLLMEVPVNEVLTTARKYRSGDKSAFFKLVKKILKPNRYAKLKLAAKDWCRKEPMTSREKIIHEAIRSHIRGEFASSITLLLTQIEGVASLCCTPKLKNNKDGKRKLKDALKHETESWYAGQALIEFVEKTLFVDSHNPAFRKKYEGNLGEVLNRHLILHGYSYSYDSEENSLRCLLILDILASLDTTSN